MICQFYDPSDFMSQGSVVTVAVNEFEITQVPPGPTCDCNNQTTAATGRCDVGWGLWAPLTLVGHLGRDLQGAIGMVDLLDELSAGHPVCVRIAWSGGGGHAIIVNGAEKLKIPVWTPIPGTLQGIVRYVEADFVFVEDPGGGPTECSFDSVRRKYYGSGSWAETFMTVSG